MRMIYPGEDRTQRKEKLQARPKSKKKKKKIMRLLRISSGGEVQRYSH